MVVVDMGRRSKVCERPPPGEACALIARRRMKLGGGSSSSDRTSALKSSVLSSVSCANDGRLYCIYLEA